MVAISVSFILTSLVIAVICYLTTSNIFYALAILLIFAAYYFLYLRKRFKNYNSFFE